VVDSLAYREDNTMNTYAWIIATADSNVRRAIWAKIILPKIADELTAVWFPRRVNNRCPAIILAAKRTDRVMGRINLLTVSINTMNDIRAEGVD